MYEPGAPVAHVYFRVDSVLSLVAVMADDSQVEVVTLARSAACSRTHSVVRRCARWPLTTHDRAGRDDLGLKQGFLAEILYSGSAGPGQRGGSHPQVAGTSGTPAAGSRSSAGRARIGL